MPTVAAAGRRGRRAPRDDLVHADRAARCMPSAPACSRLMSSRFSTSRVSRSSDSSAVASSSSRSSSSNSTSWLRRLVTAAFAEASGVRRSWLTAESSAVRSRSASAERPGGGGLLGEPLLAQRDGGLGGERLDDPPVGGRQRWPRRTRVRSGRRPGPSTSPSSGAQARLLADAGRDPPGVASSRAVRAAAASSAALQQRHAGAGRTSPAAGPAAPAAAGRRAARCRPGWTGSRPRRGRGRPRGCAGRPGRRPS